MSSCNVIADTLGACYAAPMGGVRVNNAGDFKKGDTVLVYRIEDKRSGNGPYFAGGAYHNRNEMATTHSDSTHPPLPDTFKARIPTKDRECYFCACDSIESLKVWFKGYLRKILRDKNFNIVVYECRSYDVYYGSFNQVSFLKERAKVVETISWV